MILICLWRDERNTHAAGCWALGVLGAFVVVRSKARWEEFGSRTSASAMKHIVQRDQKLARHVDWDSKQKPKAFWVN